MRKLGAVHVNEGFWFLPRTPATTTAIDDVSRDIRAEGGTAWSFAASAAGYDLDELTARFNQARAADYGEVLRHCDRFLNHIERETAARHFDFAVVEELEQDLEKRNRLLQQVHERDLLHFEGGAEADAGLQRCREALDQVRRRGVQARRGRLSRRKAAPVPWPWLTKVGLPMHEFQQIQTARMLR